uniref:Uncharacterized protein n=1 Tax=Candidatus Kentrum sp. TUN TaxID=2126343 RepID=A0A451A6G0_9GAMM|nr:MAG: hypothetical protein BECKTUN1418D_GA0071000_112011 [Candidatus Kentron sp. TUN]VFK61609.1 MAG: hypothetical protein BECKTUN1418F_GA0071002_12632 [Candidatus Kentron sp. TUN]VFK70431.1 MAG: hypothetical protein BECKTUN1418E_GA0071001_12652 [Candidatus Kentron sp. TUN]
MSIKDPEKGNSTPSQETPHESSSAANASPERPAVGGEVHLERFATTFQASARRWEMIVYPSMLAFIILAVYGFYLVYSLTRDMHTLSLSMDPDMQPHMDTLAVSVTTLSKSIDIMSDQVVHMTQSVQNMDKTMIAINTNITFMRDDMSQMTKSMNNMEPMLVNLSEMNTTMHKMNNSIVSMTVSLGRMGHDVGAASRQFVRPMSFINSFAPW